MKKLYTNK